MKKLLLIASMVAALTLAIIAVQPARALSQYPPTDIYGQLLHDGDLISASTFGDPDIYIVKLATTTNVDFWTPNTNGYKRLFLNPAIFSFYSHLGGFANVRPVSPNVRDSFDTSGLFRNCETQSEKVWATEVTGEDIGIFHHVQISGEEAYRQDPHFFSKVFCINTREENFYPQSISAYTDLRQLPVYPGRQQVCAYEGQPAIGRPCCDSMIPYGAGLICGQPYTPTPTPTSVLDFSANPTYTWDTRGTTTLSWSSVGLSDCHATSYPQNSQWTGVIATTGGASISGLTSNTTFVMDCYVPTHVQRIAYFTVNTPQSNSVTVQNVTAQVTGSNGYSNTYDVSISGYLPSPCYTLTSAVASSGARYDITLTAAGTTTPCVQTTSTFTQHITLSNSPGTYQVYVNGQFGTSFTVVPNQY